MSRDLFDDVSTADDGERSAFDFYESPGWMTRSLLAHHPIIKGSLVLECCAGRGAITNVLLDHGCEVIENDLNPEHNRTWQKDMTKRESWLQLQAHAGGQIDYVITNLPFIIAKRVLEVGIDIPTEAFITLLLKSFDEPTGVDKRRKPKPDDRGEWLASHPWTRKICLPRHGFRGEGSPPMATDWFIWEKWRNVLLPPCVVDNVAKTR